MSKRDTNLLLLDILESASKILRYTENHDFETFISDDKTLDAVIRNFEIIGEAAKRVDDNTKITNPEIEWRRMTAFRNRIIHDYFGVDYQIVWNIIRNDIGTLVEQIQALLDTE